MIELQKYSPSINDRYEENICIEIDPDEFGDFYKKEDVNPLLEELEELRNYKKFVESQKS